MTPDAFRNIGVHIDILIVGWIAFGCFAITALCAAVAYAGRHRMDWADSFAAGIAAIIGALAAIIWVLLLIPFDSRYWYDYRVEGHVTSVSNVLAEADGELTRQPVVRLDTVDRPLVIDDPRAVDLLDRDVVLRCSINWQFRAADKYECKIISFGGAQ